MHGLDLFSGYGGITLALSKWVIPIAYCEIDRYARGILLSRMSEYKLPKAPIWDDINTFPSKDFKNKVDIIYGGFPCQDISLAGNGKGLEGERSGLFFRLCKVVEEIEPSFIFLENVPAIRTRGLYRITETLTNMGYDCRWTCVSAAEVGAPHLRKRWFLLAYSCSNRKKWDEPENRERSWLIQNSSNVRNEIASGNEQQRIQQSIPTSKTWKTKSSVGRVVDGCSNRVDRIKALGNGVVPLQAKKAFEKLIGNFVKWTAY